MAGISETLRDGAVPIDDIAKNRHLIPLREVVLSGKFIGHGDEHIVDRLSGFLSSQSLHSALTNWFGDSSPDDVRGALDRDIVELDMLLSEQLDVVLHHPAFLQLEGRWRGLHWLLHHVETSSRLIVRILNVSWVEICRDLELASDFDQSLLFRKIYEEEFGTAGGTPYGLMIVDHDVRHRTSGQSRTDDVNALAALGMIGAAAFSPMIVGASPALLDVDHFHELSETIDVMAPLRNDDHARWRGLATRTDMRFVGVVLPRLQARQPWQDDGSRKSGFRYTEYAPAPEHRVWSSASYAFAVVVGRAFTTFGWPADVRGIEIDRVGGGLVQDIAPEAYSTDPAGVWSRIPLEIVWTDRQERELLAAGLIPLASVPNTEDSVFGAASSVLTPQRYSGRNAAVASANARLSTQINSTLCASRFAHYVKVMGREMVGSFRTSDEIQRQLEAWLTQYVNGNLAAGGESRAQHPLVAAQVEVEEQLGKPGSFRCVIRLQPHYQLDDMAASFQLVTEFGEPS
jgi:type VI secretion system ImpC/EvpB family protein